MKSSLSGRFGRFSKNVSFLYYFLVPAALQLARQCPTVCRTQIEVKLQVFFVPMVQLFAESESDENKHRGGLQFGIDPSILLVGSMPERLM